VNPNDIDPSRRHGRAIADAGPGGLAARYRATGERGVFVIVGLAPGCGKTESATGVGNCLELERISTSTLIAEQAERLRGMAPGTIARARARDRDAYRDLLGRVGDLMTDAGEPPPSLAICRGYRVIDGARRVADVEHARWTATGLGLVPFVLCLRRRETSTYDISESALLETANEVIDNDFDLQYLAAQTIDFVATELEHLEWDVAREVSAPPARRARSSPSEDATATAGAAAAVGRQTASSADELRIAMGGRLEAMRAEEPAAGAPATKGTR